MPAIVAGALLAASCHTSPKPQAVPQATNPFGVRGTVSLAYGRSYEGELLAVTDTSWVMLVDGRVSMVRTTAVHEVSVPTVGTLKYANGRAKSNVRLERAQRLTRYPYGIPPEAMAALLAKASQEAPDDLELKSQ